MLTGIPLDICPGVVQQTCLVALSIVFLRKLLKDFRSGCTNLNSHQQCIMSSHTYTLASIWYFLLIAILTGVRWNLSDVLICISFMAKDGENFFMYVFAMCTAENCLFNSFAHLFIGVFVLLVFNFLSFYIFWI
jgi:hypothetical protein